jgi:hypothetical protein
VLALAGLRPWETDSVGPKLSVAPDLGATVGEAEAVARQPLLAIAPAREAPGIPVAVAAEPVAYPASGGAPGPLLAVAPARAVQIAAADPVPSPVPVVPQPVATPVPSPAPAASPAPVPAASTPVAGVPGSGEGPIRSGVEPPPVCEGDEYLVIVYYEVDEVSGEQIPVELLIRRTEVDGEVSELSVEGDLSGYRELIEALTDEPECLVVEYEPAGEEEAPEAPEAPVVEPAATLEPALP